MSTQHRLVLRAISGVFCLILSVAASEAIGISGTVVNASGGGMFGVAVELWDATDTAKLATVTTYSNGGYYFGSLAAGVYIVRPVKSGWEFSPENLSVHVQSATVSDVDFAGALSGKMIAGYVKNSAGQGLSEVAVTLSGFSNLTTSTGSSGYFNFSGLNDGSYEVRPSFTTSLGTWSFNPSSQNVTLSGSSIMVVDFIGSEPEDTVIRPNRIYSDGFESTGTCDWSSCNPTAPCPPDFEGIALLAATDQDEITMAWTPAFDETTAPGAMKYWVHLSTEPGFTPGPSTLAPNQPITGGNQAVIQGLEPDTTYYALVIAEDKDGQQSIGKGARQISTPSVPPIPSSTTLFQTCEGLNLGEATKDGTNLVFQKTTSSVPPTMGAVLVGPLADGGGFIRFVDAVNVTATQISIAASPTTLQDGFDQLNIQSNGYLVDVEAEVTKQLASASATGTAKRGTSNVRRFSRPNGEVVSRIEWPGRLLRIESVRRPSETEDVVYDWGEEGDEFRASLKAGDLGKITLSAGVDFEPELITDATFTAAGVESAEVIARGTLSFEALAKYEWSQAAEYSKTLHVGSPKTWTAYYTAGPVPVFQRITLSIDAVLSATASAEITAQALAEATATIEVGARYDKVNGWQPVINQDFERSLSASLNVKGGVTGGIRLIPKLEVKFYESLAAWITVEPALSGEIGVEGTLMPMCLPFQLTSFDFDLNVEAKVGIGLSTFLGDWPWYESTVWQSPTWELFDLPQFDVAASGFGPVDLTASVFNGVNNPFKVSSSAWHVEPSTTATITPDPSNPRLADLECDVADTYTVTFSGYGLLGHIGRRCEQISVYCEPLVCSASFSENPINFTAPGGSLGVDISIANGCNWAAETSDDWISFSGGGSGNGPGTLTVLAAENLSTSSRTGYVHVDGEKLTVTQDGAQPDCTMTLEPSSLSFTADPSSDEVTVNVAEGCTWSATPSAGWIGIVGASTGNGPGFITISATENTSTSDRDGSVAVEDKTVTIHQEGYVPQCSYSLYPTGQLHFFASETSLAIRVQTQEYCSWSASSQAPWATFPSGSGTTGSGQLVLKIDQNLTGATRNSSISIADQAIQISQLPMNTDWAGIQSASDTRVGHAAIWTGQEMIVWGGSSTGPKSERYNPWTNAWASLPTANQPASDRNPLAFWTGTEMIALSGYPVSGAIFDPSSNQWRSMNMSGAPTSIEAAVWTGTELFVWSGENNAKYNFAANNWDAVNMVGAPTTEWSAMVAWAPEINKVFVYYPRSPAGGLYDPTSNSWTTISVVNAPSSRHSSSLTWTGEEFVVWGGTVPYGNSLKTGGRYNPATDTWAPTTTTGAPSARQDHTAVWTGDEMVVWGGAWMMYAPATHETLNTGAIYNPSTDTWRGTPTTSAPDKRDSHSAVWAGGEMIIFGGERVNDNYYTMYKHKNGARLGVSNP